MGSNSESIRPHAVFVPVPLQGHINPLFTLAKLLHRKGFHITFVNTEYIHKRLLKSRGPNSLDGLPDFRFETIPDGLPPSDSDASQDIPSLMDSMMHNSSVPFRNLLAKLNYTASSNMPPVTCVFADGFMSFTLDASEEFGIPIVLFWTPSAIGFLGYMQFPHLVERGLVPLKDESYLTNGYLDTTIDWIPGMKNIRLKDLPSFIRTTDANDKVVNFIIREGERAARASAIILNTFESFEKEALDSLSSMLPHCIYTIGPLQLLADQITTDDRLQSMGTNMWKEESGVLEWLNSKEPNSVVYVNFGSITVVTPEQLIELAWGLANSEKPFLWIIRPDLVEGKSAILPPEFLTKTKDRAMLASWCPQVEVLKHPSVGGFLMHSGWNSTLESISGGVPMICWPFFSEQQTNCWYSCTEWGIGMELDHDVQRDGVEKLVREIMEGRKSEEMKKKAMEWKIKAEEAAKPGGSSYQNLDKLISEVLLAGNVNQHKEVKF